MISTASEAEQCASDGNGRAERPVALWLRPGVWWIPLADNDFVLGVDGVALDCGTDVSLS